MRGFGQQSSLTTHKFSTGERRIKAGKRSSQYLRD
jgi:hypothetical protein